MNLEENEPISKVNIRGWLIEHEKGHFDKTPLWRSREKKKGKGK